MAKKEKKKVEARKASNEWINTYSDMITLCLCFFVAMYEPDDPQQATLAAMASTFPNAGQGASAGGMTLSAGKSASLGQRIDTLPSMERGEALGTAYEKAVSLFNPEIKSNMVRVTHDERGLVIRLAGDAFFNPASARINIEETRDTLLRMAAFFNSNDLAGRRYRIEGHTDDTGTDPNGPWESNWDLSSARAISVLHYLADIGIKENRFQVAGFADTMPIANNETEEGKAYNRRVDIVVLDAGHL
jgi:chemotaxis protein MotB